MIRRLPRWRLAALATLALTLSTTPAALAADDSSIQGELRTNIRASMQQFIRQKTVDGVYHHYDPVEGKLLRLTFDTLHSGIVRTGDFYVSCADFSDQAGRKLDMDFLVVPAGAGLLTTQAILHKVDGVKRPYDVESR